MSQDEFQQLSTKVEQVIEEIVGVPAEQLLIEDRKRKHDNRPVMLLASVSPGSHSTSTMMIIWSVMRMDMTMMEMIEMAKMQRYCYDDDRIGIFGNSTSRGRRHLYQQRESEDVLDFLPPPRKARVPSSNDRGPHWSPIGIG